MPISFTLRRRGSASLLAILVALLFVLVVVPITNSAVSTSLQGRSSGLSTTPPGVGAKESDLATVQTGGLASNGAPLILSHYDVRASDERPVITANAAVSAGGPEATYPSHYWAGVYYTGSSTTATELRTTVSIPDDFPQSGGGQVWYVVLLSVFDSANSYDQIGFGSSGGMWGVAYSWSIDCTNYQGQSTGYVLERGQTYALEMSISSGTVYFSWTVSGASSPVFTASAPTGASNFRIEGTDSSCGGDYGLTDYEEVEDTVGPLVPYDFFFSNNSANSFGTIGTWGIMTGGGAPSGVNVYIGSPGSTSSNGCPSDCPIMIANQPYYLSFTNGQDSTTAEPSVTPKTSDWSVTVQELSSDSPIYLTFYTAPTGWNANLVTTQGTPEFSSEFTFSVPASASAGSYYVGVNATDGSGSGSYTHIELAVKVLPMLLASPSMSPGSGGLDAGQSTTISADAQGGQGPYSYSWTAAPTGCSLATTASFQCTPGVAGTFALTVSVTDSLDYSAAGTSTVVIDTDPIVSLIKASPSTVDVGQNVVFQVSATGGSGAYTYVWTGLPGGCSTTDQSYVSCNPSTDGVATVTVKVTDSNGFSVTSSPLFFTVAQPASSGNPGGLAGLGGSIGLSSGSLWWILLLVILVVAALLITLAVRRRKRPSSSGSSGAAMQDGTVGCATVPYQGQGTPTSGPALPVGPGAAATASAVAVSPVSFEPGSTGTAGLEPESVPLGTPLVTPPDLNCWHCQYENRPGSRYCARCGLPLEAPPSR